MTVCACPTCGAPLPDVPVEAMRAALTRSQAVILDAVIRTPGLSVERVADALYGADPNGGPENAAGVVRQQVCKANVRLARMGWRITGKDGGQGYRLVRVAAR